MYSYSQSHSQHSQQHHHHRNDPTIQLIQSMQRKEDQFRSHIKAHNASCTSLAQRLQHQGDLEELLGKEKMEGYRNQIKGLAEQSVQQDRQLTAYMASLQNLRGEVLQNSSQPNSTDDHKENKDFQGDLETFVSAERKKLERSSVQVQQERLYLNVLEALGEGAAQQEANEDDELQVLPSQHGNSQASSLKCPITGSFLVDPVKSKRCRHVYSKEAIHQHLRRDRHGRCPVAGCVNRSMTVNELEDDPVTANLVRREKIRQEHSQQQQSQNAIDMDDYDEE